MEWIEVFVATSRIGLEPVEGVLYQCGLTGLMIHDEADFAEFLENPNREWDYVADELVEEKEELETGITFFLRDNLYGREQLAQIQGALAAVKASEKELDLGSLELKMKNVQEEDWANNWKKYFKPFPVGEKIMIKPSWEELTEETDKVILKIDPGHIFGTGTHETTQLCMELIEKYVKKDDMVLDIGCGSGILSIASLLLEAKEADAVDIDPNAIAIAYENSDRNDIPREKYHVCAGNILEDAALLMYKHDIGCLPVVNDANEVVGILTSNDVLSAFLDILGYRTSGSRVCIEVKDELGTIGKISEIFVRNNCNITHLGVYSQHNGFADMIIRIDTFQTDALASDLEANGYKVLSITKNPN